MQVIKSDKDYVNLCSVEEYEEKQRLASEGYPSQMTMIWHFIKKNAHKYPSISIDDMESRLCVLYTRLLYQWNPQRGKFNTFFYFCAKRLMRHLLKLDIRDKEKRKEYFRQLKKEVSHNDKAVFENKEFLDAITMCLNDQDRQIIHMYYYEDLSCSIIAKELDYSKERVRQIKRDAIYKLRKFIKTNKLV